MGCFFAFQPQKGDERAFPGGRSRCKCSENLFIYFLAKKEKKQQKRRFWGFFCPGRRRFCSVVHCDYGIDAWGRGTAVTVSSGRASAPKLFPLVSCGMSESSELYSVGCLAMDFLPEELTFSWTNYVNDSISSGVSAFPSVLAGEFYTVASQLTLPLMDGKSQQPFYCWAQHAEGNRVLEVANPGPVDVVPTVSIHPPSREDFEGPYRNSTVLCRAVSSRKLPLTVQWLKNGALQEAGVATEGPVSDGHGAYVTSSGISVSQSDWDAGTVYTCKVDAEMRNTSKALECGFERPPDTDIVVKAIPPAFADIFIDKVAKLTCRVSNLPSVEGLAIAWRKETGQELETRTLPQVLQPNGLYSVDGVASVCADEWDKGEVYVCRVSHPDLLFPVEEKLQRKADSNARAPTIYVLPPPAEQLALQETATVTCLVKGFNPPDLFVRWLRNGEPVAAGEYVTLPPAAEGPAAPSYFAYSALSVSGEDWGAGNVYTCLVGHEKLPLQVAQKSVDKSSGKPTSVNVSLVLADAANACY